MKPVLNLIVAVSSNMGIGVNGDLPWRLKKELAYFSRMTKLTSDESKKNAVIMGRKTWESIPQKNRPLAGRVNIVLSRSILDLGEGVLVHNSLESALGSLNQSPLKDQIEIAWVIGGSSLYKEVMESSLCHRMYITRVLKEFECDTFLPEIKPSFTPVLDPNVPEGIQEENGIQYGYEVYQQLQC
ncbi:dihydrofolate reductase [Anabrus simplex]|uniref:dihydrofolate reductase n=1 Tax=Anabrus simplex TaxID=316456 RepID=UPI0034DD47BE